MKKCCCIFFLFIGLKCFASHIVGGEIIYDYLVNLNGKDHYRITLKIYRDCAQGNAAFDNPAIITVRDANGLLTGTFNIGAPLTSTVAPSINNPCIKPPEDICVEEGVYTYTLALTPKTGGYYVIYQRCCRNATIDNILTPGNVGSTYFTKITGPEEVPGNSSPHFNNFPPIYLCNETDFTFDHSAFDPDGDLLVYSFYTPFLGLDGCCPSLGSAPPGSPSGSCPSLPATCPTEAPFQPYAPVNYIAPYSGNYPIASNPAFTINPGTGQLTGRPNLIGQFVVGVCVKEYHDNQLINTHFRDFQFNVKACLAVAVSAMAAQENKCEGSIITFTNLSTGNTGPTAVHWDFGVANLSNDTSNLFNPTYNFPDTGKYTVTLIANPRKPCSDTLARVFYIYPKLDIFYTPPPKQCFKNNSFNFNLQGVYDPNTSFTWEFTSSASPTVSNLQSPTDVAFIKGGLFTVTLNAQYAICEDTFTASVNVIDLPPAPSVNWDTTVVVGQLVPLNAYAGNGYTYTWTPVVDYLNCSTCLISNPVSSTNNDITYTVFLQDPDQCHITKSTYSIFVDYRTSLDVPSAFTPNGDGINDVIYVEGWGLKKLLYFRVFNRWGQLLFESNDLKTGWDGRFNGVAQNMETYIYQVSVETYLEEPKTLTKDGTFRLIR